MPYDELRTVFYGPLECEANTHTIPNEPGNECVCESGFAEVLLNSSRLSCARDCPDEGTRATHDGSSCECSDRFYSPVAAGVVDCALGDWPPEPLYDAPESIASRKCLPCPDTCADCVDGAIWAKLGWRLNGSVGSRNLSHFGLPQQRRQQTLYLCPAGSDGSNGMPVLCPAFPLDDPTQRNYSFSCADGREGPLCQSCGPGRMVDKTTKQCTDCPKADFNSIMGCSLAVFGAIVCLIGLLVLVSWTPEDTKSAEEGVQILRQTLSRTLSNQSSAASGAGPLDQLLTDRTNSTEGLERHGSPLLARSPSQEPSVGTFDIFAAMHKIEKDKRSALHTVRGQLAMQSVRILISYVQVISQLGDVLHVQLPELFVEWLHALRLLTVDLTAFLSRCLMPCLSVYQQWLLYVIIVPAVMIALVAMLRVVDSWRKMGYAERSEKFKIRGAQVDTRTL